MGVSTCQRQFLAMSYRIVNIQASPTPTPPSTHPPAPAPYPRPLPCEIAELRSRDDGGPRVQGGVPGVSTILTWNQMQLPSRGRNSLGFHVSLGKLGFLSALRSPSVLPSHCHLHDAEELHVETLIPIPPPCPPNRPGSYM